MLTNVQVLPGTTSVARFEDVVVWYETGPDGGGVMLTQLLQAVQGVSSGSVPSRQLGARLAAVLNTGDAKAVPALVAATPEGEGLRVVVHGWGAVVADGLHVPNGWVDQVIADRRTFFLGRNTVTPVAPLDGSRLDLEDGVVPGDGVSFALSGAGRAGAPPTAAEPVVTAEVLAPSAAGGSPWEAPAMPVAAAPSTPTGVPAGVEPPAYEPPPSDPPLVATPRLPLGRLVLDDGSAAVLEHTCVLGSAPYGSPAVQTGVAIPLTVTGAGVAPLHAELRVEADRVSVRDLGSGATHVLAPGTPTWATLAPGQIRPITPGTRIALGQRTLSYERP